MIDRELVMDTLLAKLSGMPAVYTFSADLTADDVVLRGIADTTHLRLGMPLGILDPDRTGIVPGTVIAAIGQGEITLSIAPFQSGSQVPLVQGFLTISRAYGEPGPDATYPHPALFLVDYDEDYPSDHSTHRRATWEPGIVTLMAIGHIHVRIAAGIPATPANRLLEALEEALEPPADYPLGRQQTLDLLGVHHARIEGRVLKDAHRLDYVVYKVPFLVDVLQATDIVPDPDPIL